MTEILGQRKKDIDDLVPQFSKTSKHLQEVGIHARLRQGGSSRGRLTNE